MGGLPPFLRRVLVKKSGRVESRRAISLRCARSPRGPPFVHKDAASGAAAPVPSPRQPSQGTGVPTVWRPTAALRSYRSRSCSCRIVGPPIPCSAAWSDTAIASALSSASRVVRWHTELRRPHLPQGTVTRGCARGTASATTYAAKRDPIAARCDLPPGCTIARKSLLATPIPKALSGWARQGAVHPSYTIPRN